MPEFKEAPPKYVQIADHVRSLITSGELALGSEVSSERELAAMWGVARPTATKALDVLRREGLIGSGPGRGTFVIGPSTFNHRADERYTRSDETGKIYPANERAEILSAELVEAPDHVADLLGVDRQTSLLRRVRRTLRDDKPIETSASWFPPDVSGVAPRLAELERILGGTVAYVEQQTGRRRWLARDRMSARASTEAEAELLEVEHGSPVLATRHLVLDRDSKPLELAEAVAPADAWTVEHEYVLGVTVGT